MTSRGSLVPLKTLYELEVKENLVEACVVEFPVKLASKVVSVLKKASLDKDEKSHSYYFLRRLVLTSHLPSHLRNDVKSHDDFSTIHLIITPPFSSASDNIAAILQPHIDVEGMPIIRMTQIPCNAPTTAEQAAHWSKNYWPCIFNPASQVLQKAPPLHVLRGVLTELDNPVKLVSLFQLANVAASACREGGFGRQIAAVVVNPVNGETIAVAGDARWYSHGSNHQNRHRQDLGLSEGRPEQHALMRTIAMVAAKDRQRASLGALPEANGMTDLQGEALTPIETLYTTATTCSKNPPHDFSPPQSTPRLDAYLCTGLDLYITHEPCVACSMAMLHSRFRACIFTRRMPYSGGLCADKTAEDGGGLGYGLFWRKELNWRVLALQWDSSRNLGGRADDRDDDDGGRGGGGGGEAGRFHA